MSALPPIPVSITSKNKAQEQINIFCQKFIATLLANEQRVSSADVIVQVKQRFFLVYRENVNIHVEVIRKDINTPLGRLMYVERFLNSNIYSFLSVHPIVTLFSLKV